MQHWGKKGDLVLTASSGSRKTIGKNIQFDSNYNGSFGAFCKLVRPKPTINAKYLYHFFKTRFFRDTIEKAVQGANIANLKNEYIDDLEIATPETLDDQIRIATVLTRAEKLIAKRKESLKALDEFLKSTFLEMFGDPVRNEKGWKTDSLEKLGTFKNGLNFTRGESGVQVRYLGVGDFKALSKITNVNSLSTISLNTMPSDEYFLRNGDIVFVRSNGNRELVGRCIAIYPNKNRVTYSGFCIRFRINVNTINSTYLTHLFRTSSFRRALLQVGQGANIQNINQKTLSALDIPLPPFHLQNQFAAIIEKVESLKIRYTQSLTELENLYGSLSQRAFKGELDLSKIPSNQIERNAQTKMPVVEPFKRIPRPKFSEQYKGNTPLLPLKIAAGGFSDQQIANWENWAEIKTSQPIRKGWFVAQVVGDSMEPLIPKGSFCLFKPFFMKPHKDKILLIQQHEENDPETGGKYTLKMIEQKTDRDTSEIVEVRLVSLNPKYPPKIYHEDPHLKPVAEFAEVLGN